MNKCRKCGNELGDDKWWARIGDDCYAYCSQEHIPQTATSVAREHFEGTLADILKRKETGTVAT